MSGVSPPPLRRAEIVAVGSEMLAPDRTDTNSLHITARLNDLGIEVRAKAIVGDDPDDLAAIVAQALERADLVVITGGLGPTDDDLTRDAVARVLGRGMHEDEATIERIRARFARRGMAMPAINRRQGLVIDGADLIENGHGTAPGQWVPAGDRLVLLLPGPPREMRPMIDTLVAGRLATRAGAERLHRRIVRIAGHSESHAEELLRPLYARWREATPPLGATILAAFGLIELQINARGADAAQAEATLDAAVADVVGCFGADVFSTDAATLEAVVGRLLRARGARLALAESCTGGLATSRLTDMPGSSDYVERAVVAYSNAAKIELLGVPAQTIADHGAVSEPVALAMAEGVRRLAGVEIGVGITGIAGPGGGTDTKPVGTVFVAVAGPADRARARSFLFPGGRTQVKALAAQMAIDQLRRALLEPGR
jgi:nicotinamide-nucleotide amidase